MRAEISIEDFFEDILGKAMRGLGIQSQQLSEKTGVPPETIQQLTDGHLTDEDSLRTLATALELDPDALVTSAKKEWYPHPCDFDGIRQFNTPWHDMLVNAFLVWDPKTLIAAAFDTGTDASEILSTAKSLNLKLESIFITHTHGDHIADLKTLLNGCDAGTSIYTNRLEPLDGAVEFEEGAEFAIGNLKVHTFTTSGHSIGGTTYFIEGLEQPIAIVGDSMFAGSMGGGQISYTDALENNRSKILTLPDNTIICPGHGPMSSIKEEKTNNPFFPEFK